MHKEEAERKRYRHEYYLKNRERVISKSKQYYLDNKSKVLNRIKIKERASYFSSLNQKEAEREYQEILLKQKGLCAICFRPEKIKNKKTGQVRSLAIDHRHSDGKARGLLCFECNTALGKLEKNWNRLMEYLNV